MFVELRKWKTEALCFHTNLSTNDNLNTTEKLGICPSAAITEYVTYIIRSDCVHYSGT